MLKADCDQDDSGTITLEELNSFFMRWTEIKNKVKERAQWDDEIEQAIYINDERLYQKELVLQLVSTKSGFQLSSTHDQNRICITAAGLRGDHPARITRFGKGAATKNHVSFNTSDLDLCEDMFQIYCDSDGYHIVDFYNSRKCSIRIVTEIELTKGTSFAIGRVLLHVTDADNSRICLNEVSETGSLKGKRVIERSGEPSIIGRSEECQVRLKDKTVSGGHAEINGRAGKWILKDLGSKQGTWVNLSNSSNAKMGEVNPPRRLNVGEVIGTTFYRFEVISA
jgi:hypothetical protein